IGRESHAPKSFKVLSKQAQFLGPGNVPDTDGLIVTTRKQRLAIAGKRKLPDPFFVTVEPFHFFASTDVPTMNRPILLTLPTTPTSEQVFAVWGKEDLLNLVFLFSEPAHLLAAGYFPENDSLVLPIAGGQMLTVRRKS